MHGVQPKPNAIPTKTELKTFALFWVSNLFSKFRNFKFIIPIIWREKRIIINPEKILSSIELFYKIFPIRELVAPNAIKMRENPTVNKIIGIILTLFSSSNSFKDLPDT